MPVIERKFCSPCDGYGAVVNTKGIIVKCPHCDGRRLSNAEVKATRNAR